VIPALRGRLLGIHTAVFLGKAAIVGGYPSAYGASVGSRWLRREVVDADEPLVATGGARNLAAIWDVIASTFACGMVSRYLQRFRVFLQAVDGVVDHEGRSPSRRRGLIVRCGRLVAGGQIAGLQSELGGDAVATAPSRQPH
jgi:hypothetical protein